MSRFQKERDMLQPPGFFPGRGLSDRLLIE